MALTVGLSTPHVLAADRQGVSGAISNLLFDSDFCTNGMRRILSSDPNIDFEKQAIRDLTALVIREYLKAGYPSKNENLKHVRRMIDIIRSNRTELEKIGLNPDEIISSLYISDMAKSQHIIDKYKDTFFNGDYLTAFLEHSRMSMFEADEMAKKLGISDEAWQRLTSGVIGHDGPSIPGTWWEEMYSKKLGKPYPKLMAQQGVIHAYLDRMDQGGLYRINKSLEGGIRKISYDMYNRKKTPQYHNLTETVKYAFGDVHEKTIPQLDHLDQVVVPKFFPEGNFPPFLRKQRAEFDQSQEYLEFVEFKGNPQRVIIKDKDGAEVVVKTLDEFWLFISVFSNK
ncbi:MAG: hypothetical protein SGI74_08000 [Oligoflexia bacterium]|nr:hypothetical protein [Oligoflexia bacterium]